LLASPGGAPGGAGEQRTPACVWKKHNSAWLQVLPFHPAVMPDAAHCQFMRLSLGVRCAIGVVQIICCLCTSQGQPEGEA
jgi:hypothetical protein